MKTKSLLLAVLMLFTAVNCLYSGSKRMVLVEEFTGTNCPACAAANPTFKSQIEQKLDLIIPLVFVSSSKSPPNYGVTGRVGAYVSGTYGIPATWVNGEKVSPTSAASHASKWSSQTSPISIDVLENRNGLNVSVTVRIESDDEITGDKRLFVAVVQDEINFTTPPGTNGETDFRWVVSKMLPGPYPSQGKRYNSEAGQVKNFDYSYTMGAEWDPDNVYTVAFIQDFDNSKKEVLQVGKTSDPSKMVPKIAVNQTGLDFGKVTDEKTMSFEIENTGYADLEITEMRIDFDNAGVFEVVNPVSSIAPFQKNEVNVKFTPKDNAYYNGKLVIKCNAENKKQHTIQLVGQGYNIEQQPEITFDSESIDFGTTNEGDTKLKITNTGIAPLNIELIEIRDDEDNVFKLDLKDEFPITVEENKDYDVKILFEPKANITFTAECYIKSNAANGTEKTIEIQGTGEGVETQAILAVDKTSIDFGSVSTTKTEIFTITNDGYKLLEVTEVDIVDYNNVYSLVDAPTEAIKLEHGETHELEIEFAPTSNTSFAASIRFKSNHDGTSASPQIGLNGRGDEVESVAEMDLFGNGVFRLEASPNPFADELKISWEYSGEIPVNVNISIFDILGSEVLELYSGKVIPGSNMFTPNCSSLSDGYFTVAVEIEGRIMSLPIIHLK